MLGLGLANPNHNPNPSPSPSPNPNPNLGESECGDEREAAGRAAEQEHVPLDVARLLRTVVPCVRSGEWDGVSAKG